MHPNANNFRIRQCTVCGFNFSDEHHIHAEILGKDNSPTIILCPNHHRLAHILQCRLSSKESIRSISPDFSYSFLSEQSLHFTIVSLCIFTSQIKILYKNSLLKGEVNVKELEEALEIYNNYRFQLEEAIEIHKNYLPKLESIVEKLEIDASRESINCNLKSEEILRLEEETYSKFCRIIGLLENGYSRIIWNKLIDKCIELNKKGYDAKAFIEHLIHVAKKLAVTKSLTD